MAKVKEQIEIQAPLNARHLRAWTKEQIMHSLNLTCKAWDYALPHHWCRDVKEKTGIWPAPHFVWLYDDRSPVFGRPFPITKKGAMILYLYAAQGGFA